MPTPAWDDLGAFTDPEDFGVLCLAKLKDGTEREFSAIFDAPYMNAELGEYEADNDSPRLTGQACHFEGMQRGDRVKVPGEGWFTVLSYPQGDGTGMAVLSMARE